MEINRELFDKIASLAKLEFGEEEANKMMKDMQKIINWVEKLDELDTEGIKPLLSMTQEVNVLRDDVNEDHIDKKIALKNAPNAGDDYFHVPKVID